MSMLHLKKSVEPVETDEERFHQLYVKIPSSERSQTIRGEEQVACEEGDGKERNH